MPRMANTFASIQRRNFMNHVRNIPNLRHGFVMGRQKFMRNFSLALGHSGYLVGLLEYGVTDIVLLRLFAMTGASFIVFSQLALPKVQWVTAFWNFAYSSVNLFQLALLREGPEPELTWEETLLHRQYQRHIDVRIFHALVGQGEWLWLVDGTKLLEPGADAGGQLLYFTIAGECKLSVGEHVLAVLGPGSVVGEMGVLAEPADVTSADFCVTACGTVRCFAIPVQRVQQLMELQPPLRGAMDGILADALADKLFRLNQGIKERNYRAVLEVFCGMDGHTSTAPLLQAYREDRKSVV